MNTPINHASLVTGAGSGLGRALALQLSTAGAGVTLLDRDAAAAEQTAQLARELGARAIALHVDVTQPGALEAAFDQHHQEFGRLDLLANNAGVAAAGLVGDLPLSDWEWVLNINLRAVIIGCHLAAPILKRQRFGSILNVASGAGFVSLPEMGAYNVSKAGVIALSETLYAELAPYNCGVSVLCPTFFRTNLMQSFRAPHERQRLMAERMFKLSTMNAEQVAAFALAGIKSRQLMLVPQIEAGLLWRLKRLSPALFHKALALQQRYDVGGKILG